MNVVIFGATGRVGTEVLHKCLGCDQILQVLTIGRRTTLQSTVLRMAELQVLRSQVRQSRERLDPFAI